jgi:drug/metabolite transporter (DMT)-like permease
VTAVALACASAALFGAMSVAVRFGVRSTQDPELGALTITSIAFVLTAIVGLAVTRELDLGELWPFLIAGVLAPGLSQVFFVRAVREAGAARSSVLMGTAPLVAVAIALVFLGEPARAPLLVGAALIVGGGIALARERVRPADFRRLGVLLAVITTVLFAIRDNVLRSFTKDTHVHALVAAPVSLLAGTATISLYLLLTRGSSWSRGYGRQVVPFLPAAVLFGVSYLALFGAYYRGGVSVVNPLVATESLWGVGFALLLLRRTELIGRWLVLGAALVVAGGVLIGVSR